MTRVEEKYREKFEELTKKTFSEQAKWFLNAMWAKGAEPEAENVWNFAQKMASQHPKKAAGCDLDEFESHKFIESLGETMTVIKLRETLREIDVNNDKKMALVEYLLFKYARFAEMGHLLNASQGGNAVALEHAQKKVEEAQAKLLQATTDAELAKKAEDENKAALAELKLQEDTLKNKIAELEAAGSAGGVKGNKALQELFQLRAGDPLPLQRAKINQEATVRKAEKARKAADASADAARAAVQEAEEDLEKAKNAGGGGLGTIWYLQRDLTEAKKFLPKSKQ